jgi:chloramphenicol 3-O-phosphotransferase
LERRGILSIGVRAAQPDVDQRAAGVAWIDRRRSSRGLVVGDSATALRHTRALALLERIVGMAASQAVRVHEGVRYDVVVDTTTASTEQCARAVLCRVTAAAAR